jgi:hypothetical protein
MEHCTLKYTLRLSAERPINAWVGCYRKWSTIYIYGNQPSPASRQGVALLHPSLRHAGAPVPQAFPSIRARLFHLAVLRARAEVGKAPRAKAELKIVAIKDGPMKEGQRTWRWHLPQAGEMAENDT